MHEVGSKWEDPYFSSLERPGQGARMYLGAGTALLPLQFSEAGLGRGTAFCLMIPHGPTCPIILPRSQGTSYLWFLAYIFRLSECERLVSMRFGFFSESPGPLTFKIVLSPYLHFDIIRALFPLHPVYSVPPGFSPRQNLSYLTLQSS